MSLQSKISSLIQYLQCDCSGLRQFATRRLVRLEEAAVPALINALKDRNPGVQDAAASALVSIGAHALPYLLEATHHEDSQIRLRACWVLSSMLTDIREQLAEKRASDRQGGGDCLAS